MKVTVEFEIERVHCFYCPLRVENGWDYCKVQLDKDGQYIEFGSFEEQIKNCPLKVIEEV